MLFGHQFVVWRCRERSNYRRSASIPCVFRTGPTHILGSNAEYITTVRHVLWKWESSPSLVMNPFCRGSFGVLRLGVALDQPQLERPQGSCALQLLFLILGSTICIQETITRNNLQEKCNEKRKQNVFISSIVRPNTLCYFLGRLICSALLRAIIFRIQCKFTAKVIHV